MRTRFFIAVGLLIMIAAMAFTSVAGKRVVLFVQGSQIFDGDFVVVADHGDDSDLYLGSTDGAAKWRLSGADSVTTPFILGGKRLLFVEKVRKPAPAFALVEFDYSGPEPSCRRLVESQHYFLQPFSPGGNYGDSIFFLFDKMMPAVGSNAPPNWHVAVLRNGELSFPSGPDFLSLTPLAQLPNFRLLGVAAGVYEKNVSTGQTLSDVHPYRGLLSLAIANGTLQVSPVPWDENANGEALTVSSTPMSENVWVRSYKIDKSGSHDLYVALDRNSLEVTRRIELPSDHIFGDPSTVTNSDGTDDLLALSSPSTSFLWEPPEISIATIRGEGDVKFNPIRLDAMKSFDLHACSRDGVATF